MSFGECHEVRLSDEIVVGAKSTDTYSVRITELASGDEDREEVHSQPRRKLSVSFGSRLNDVAAEIREFIAARGGPASPFVVADPSDSGVTVKTLWYDLDDMTDADWTLYTVDNTIEFPLFRGYESGGHRRYRRITKPRPVGFQVWWNDDDVTDQVQVDFGRGIVVFDYIPRAGRLYFKCSYDLCVRFDSDPTVSALTDDVTDISGLSLIELIGVEDYAPASEGDELRAALGRTDEELNTLIASMKAMAGG